MRNLTRSWLAAAVLSLAYISVGCAHVSGRQLGEAERNALASYYVEHQPKDGRHLEKQIADSLHSRGLEVSSGPAEDRPERVDYIVSYVDRWRWDLRMYLYDLRIEVLDAATGHVVGSGQSIQPSLSAMGMTFRDVIDRAVAVLFEGPIARTIGQTAPE
jgi:hypothetical protein